MRELGVGIVGFGSIGKVHACCYVNLPFFYDPPPCKAKIIGVVTSRSETAEKARRLVPVEIATTDYRRLLDRRDIHVLHVCTPNRTHREILLGAISAGKHIYCEKPLTSRYADAEEVVRALDGYGGISQMTFNYRFSPAVLRAKRIVEEGRLGTVVNFRAVYLHSGYTDPNRPYSWRLSREESGGGALFDLGSHVIDLIRWLAGEVASVSCASETFVKERKSPAGGGTVPIEVDDLSILLVKTKGGALGSIEASRVATGTEDELRFEIHGTQGAIRFNLMEPNWLEFYDARESGEPIGGTRGFKRIETVSRYPAPAGFPSPKSTLGWMRIHLACLHNFLRAVTESRPAKPDLQDGAVVQKVLDCAQRSAEKGVWVDV